MCINMLAGEKDILGDNQNHTQTMFNCYLVWKLTKDNFHDHYYAQPSNDFSKK